MLIGPPETFSGGISSKKTFPDISARICYREIWSSFSGEFVSKSNSTIVHRWANCDLDLKFGTEWDDSVENLWSLDNIQCKKKVFRPPWQNAWEKIIFEIGKIWFWRWFISGQDWSFETREQFIQSSWKLFFTLDITSTSPGLQGFPIRLFIFSIEVAFCSSFAFQGFAKYECYKHRFWSHRWTPYVKLKTEGSIGNERCFCPKGLLCREVQWYSS